MTKIFLSVWSLIQPCLVGNQNLVWWSVGEVYVRTWPISFKVKSQICFSCLIVTALHHCKMWVPSSGISGSKPLAQTTNKKQRDNARSYLIQAWVVCYSNLESVYLEYTLHWFTFEKHSIRTYSQFDSRHLAKIRLHSD